MFTHEEIDTFPHSDNFVQGKLVRRFAYGCILWNCYDYRVYVYVIH
jgi:hypothetical protein